MSGLLARLASTFVAPPAGTAREDRRPDRHPPASAASEAVALAPSGRALIDRPVAPVADGAHDDEGAPAVAVLARPPDAWAAGGAVALGLLAAARASTVVVCVWGAGTGPSAAPPATPAARRVAGRLAERGHEARASGRLVLLALGAEVGAACAETARVTAALGDEPAVVVLGGVREERADALLADRDRVVVAASGLDDPVADLAAVSLGFVDAAVRVVALAPAAPARVLAATGVALVAPLRTAIEEALR